MAWPASPGLLLPAGGGPAMTDPFIVAAADQAAAEARQTRGEAMVAAARMWVLMDSLIAAGFQRDEAFTLLLAMVEGAGDAVGDA